MKERKVTRINEKTLKELEQKASITAPGIHMMGAGQAQYTPDRVDALIKQGYKLNTWVYACVREITKAAASIPLLVYTKDSDGELTEEPHHPLQLLLNKPNDELPSADFREIVYMNLMLSGNTYIEMNGVNSAGPPLELWPWRPDRTKIVPSKEGIGHYRYIVNGMEYNLEQERMVHVKHYDPMDDYYGLSPLSVSRRIIDMDNATVEWNSSLVDNYAAPSGFLQVIGEVGRDSMRRIGSRLRRYFSGYRNAGKPFVTQGEMQWTQLGLNPKDMDFIDSRKMSREEICAAFGVPPQIVGIQDSSTYNNYSEARQSFYQDTVLPTVEKVVSGLNHKLAVLYGDNVVIGYDRSEIAALQESAKLIYERVSKVQNVITINEQRQMLGFEPIDGGDVRILQKNEIEVAVGDNKGEAVDTAKEETKPIDEPEEVAPEEEAESGEKMREAIAKLSKFLADNEDELRIKNANDLFDRLRDEYVDRIRDLFTEEMIEIKGLFSEEQDESFVEKHKELILLLLLGRRDKWRVVISTVWREVFWNHFYDAREQVMRTAPSDVTPDEVDEVDLKTTVNQYIDEVATASAEQIIQTTTNHVERSMNESIAEKVIALIALSSIQNIYNNWKYGTETSTETDGGMMSRAEVISEVESSTALSYSQRMAALSTGLSIEKTWVTQGDKKVRKSHRSAEGQTRDLEDEYRVGTSYALYPRDPMLPASERVNCRCFERYYVKDDED